MRFVQKVINVTVSRADDRIADGASLSAAWNHSQHSEEQTRSFTPFSKYRAFLHITCCMHYSRHATDITLLILRRLTSPLQCKQSQNNPFHPGVIVISSVINARELLVSSVNIQNTMHFKTVLLQSCHIHL